MGGSAFSANLAPKAFPRMPPDVYSALKARYLPKMQQIYSLVAVPKEAPEKTSYGDLDILVAEAKATDEPSEGKQPGFVPHEQIQEILGARHVVRCDENRTSNYAVPIALGEWGALGHKADEEAARRTAPDGDIYYQVDVHPCSDANEFERINFFNSYGDMGMMLGLLARQIGLRLGQHGLKLSDPPLPIFELSSEFTEILPFLGLSQETYDIGFKTQVEVFEWVASMRWFNPRYFIKTGPGIKKVKADRKMYAEFNAWVVDRYQDCVADDTGHNKQLREELHRSVVKIALEHFKKTSKFESRHVRQTQREQYRSVFSGHRVRDWAEMGEHWKGVKLIMDKVRAQLGGEDGIVRFYEENGEGALKTIVLSARDEAGLAPANKYPSTEKVTTTVKEMNI